MERPRLGPSERRAAVALIDPNEQITLQAGSDTKPRRTVLAADFRTADFVSEPKGYRARNRKFEFSSLQQTVRLSRQIARRGREPRLFARACGPWRWRGQQRQE
jgi:hypothetical protein